MLPEGFPSASASFAYDAWYRVLGAELEAGTERAEALAFAYDAIDNEHDTARGRTERQCDRIRIDSEVLMRSQLRQLVELRLETEQLHLSIALAEADLRRAVLQARRVQQHLAEAEQLAVNVESARNDPNVRITDIYLYLYYLGAVSFDVRRHGSSRAEELGAACFADGARGAPSARAGDRARPRDGVVGSRGDHSCVGRGRARPRARRAGPRPRRRPRRPLVRRRR